MTQTQLFAKIKKSSKYFGQGDGKEFPIIVLGSGGASGDYLIQGAPGEFCATNQYRLIDVNLYAEVSDKFIKIA